MLSKIPLVAAARCEFFLVIVVTYVSNASPWILIYFIVNSLILKLLIVTVDSNFLYYNQMYGSLNLGKISYLIKVKYFN